MITELIVFILLLIGLKWSKISLWPSVIVTTQKTKSSKYIIYLWHRTFSEKQFTITLHDRLVFVNKDVVRHQIVIDNPSIQNSTLLHPGDIFEVKFHKPGHYKFYSPFYKEMQSCNITCLSMDQ